MIDDNIVAMIPRALLAYYERVGAEVINFRRAIIKEHRGKYYIEKAVIRVGADGKVECREFREGDERCPTEDEQAEISRQWSDSGLPVQVKANLREAEEFAEGLDATGVGVKSTTFVFCCRATGRSQMIQQRIEVEGQRIFVPWTLFSDGMWRKFEPDTGLPFWKPRESRGLDRIMIHEGAKAAQAVDRLVQNGDGHPWKEELEEYEHWGMIGGALAPQRTNWAELKDARPVEVVYFCDNDQPGMEALQRVSQHYRRSMKGVQLDGKFDRGWDMADPMPKDLYDSAGRWNGPMLKEYMKPVTWATDVIHTGKKGRPSIVINYDFAREWFHSIKPELFVHKDWPNETYSEGEFNNKIAPFSDVPDVAAKLKKYDAGKAVEMKYVPSQPSGLFHHDGVLCLNTHVPSHVREAEGSIEPFLDYMRHLVPSEGDRTELLRWIITFVAKPEIKIKYGLLLISETQGVGKSTLGDKILAPIIGHHNVSIPTDTDITESQYDYWSVRKRLAIVHEIYSGESKKAYNKLKSVMSETEREVNQKYLAPFKIDNWVHVLACSNSRAPLKVTDTDRRWLIPKVTEKKKNATYWTEFNHWLAKEQGLGVILRWCREMAQDPNNTVANSEEAPLTEAKQEVVMEAYSDGQKKVYEILTHLRQEALEQNKMVVVLDTELQRMVKKVVHEGRETKYLEKPLTLRNVAKNLGYVVNDNKIRHKRWGKLPSFGARAVAWHPGIDKEEFSVLDVSTLMEICKEPIDVVSFAEREEII